jgi:Fur family ferric uptake transcriptional regulator/Fur family peroxide stress response transcriptional regulator
MLTDSGLQADLRRGGRRVTDQRRLILEAVRGTDTHPTAEWVYRRVRRRLPQLSLGTVYRNLKLLAEQGLIRELDSRGFDRYDGNTARHHHFTCQVCGQISDLTKPVDRGLDRQTASRTGLEIWHHRIEFYGRCRACRARARGSAGGRKPG